MPAAIRAAYAEPEYRRDLQKLVDIGGETWVTTYKKGVFMRLVFVTSKLRKLLSLVKDKATVDVLGMC